MAKLTPEAKRINDLLYLEKTINSTITTEVDNILRGRERCKEDLLEQIHYIVDNCLEFYE